MYWCSSVDVGVITCAVMNRYFQIMRGNMFSTPTNSSSIYIFVLILCFFKRSITSTLPSDIKPQMWLLKLKLTVNVVLSHQWTMLRKTNFITKNRLIVPFSCFMSWQIFLQSYFSRCLLIPLICVGLSTPWYKITGVVTLHYGKFGSKFLGEDSCLYLSILVTGCSIMGSLLYAPSIYRTTSAPHGPFTSSTTIFLSKFITSLHIN